MIESLVKEALEKFDDVTVRESYSKGDFLLRSNEYSSKIYLVEEGILRSFYYVEDKDVTADFAPKYSIIGAVDSLYQKKASIYNIEALSDCVVHRVEQAQLEAYLLEHSELERLARHISQTLYSDLVDRMESLTFLSAHERYARFLHKHSEIIKHVNLGHIASYLGMTIETLSRVRSVK